MRKLTMALLGLSGLAIAVAVGCNGLLGIDHYRGCRDIECDGGLVTNDAAADAPPTKACDTAADCGAGYTLCTSKHECRYVRALAPGMSSHQCAILDDDSVACWGTNDKGQLGTNDTGKCRQQPKRAGPNLPPVSQVTQGLSHTCALTKLGDVYCWGDSDEGGRTLVPMQVTIPRGAERVTQISSSIQSTCALLSDHRIYCWGPNTYGETSCGTIDAGSISPSPCTTDAGMIVLPTGSTAVPRLIASGAEGYSMIAIGAYGSCAAEATTGSQVHCWGDGSHIASNSTLCCAQSEVPGGGGGGLQKLVASDFYTCRQDGTGIWTCWGDNNSCAFQYPSCNTIFTNPQYIGADNNGGPAKLAAGWRHMCWTVKAGNGVYCRGSNDFGSLGNGTEAKFAFDTQQVQGLPDIPVIDVVAHRFWSCALLDDKSVWCWGANDTGCLLGVGSDMIDGAVKGSIPNVTTAMKVDWGSL